jgi:DNA-binding transcriptional LysR family regulator
MNTDAVLAFVAVAEEGQFQRAADRIGRSQQAVSKRIAGLEADLGTALFRRVPSGAVLTDDGRTFLPHARAFLAAADTAVGSVRPQARPLRVDIMSRRTAPADLLRAFRDSYPAVPVDTVAAGNGAATVRSVLAGEVDAGYAYLRDDVPAAAGPSGRALLSALAYLEPMQVIVGPRHPLARAGHVPAAELHRYRAWVPGIVPGTEWAAWYAELGATFGLHIDATRYTTVSDSVFDAVAASDSLLTFVGERSRVALPIAPVLARLPVIDPVPVYPWSLVWRLPARHPGLRRLVAHVRRSFQPPPAAAVWLPRGASSHAGAGGLAAVSAAS